MSNAPLSAAPAQAPSTGRLVGSCLILVGVLVLAFPAYAWFGYARSGANGIAVAAVALLVCGASAVLALLVTGLLQGGKQAVNALLSGMALRMGVPFAAGMLLQSQGGPLAEAGVFGMILAYYLLALAVETVLSLRLIKQPANSHDSAESSRAS
ncbi:MAG: hypothetical protein RIC55_20695 [Pirellulaceae bacterium]